MAVAYFYSNVAVPGTIGNSGGISNAATSLQATSTPSGYPAQFPFKLRLDAGTGSEEVVKVTAGAGTSGSPWTIVRGWDGTIAVSHAQSSGTIAHGMTQEDLALSRTHENQGASSPPHGLPASAWAAPSFAILGEQTMANSTTSQVTFSGIPGAYGHLLLMVQGRCTAGADTAEEVLVAVNSDGSAHYGWANIGATNLTGTLSGPSASQSIAQTAWKVFSIASAGSGAADNAGGGWCVIPNYANSAFNKNFYSLTGFNNGTAAPMSLHVRAGAWKPISQNAVTRLDISVGNGNFVTGTFIGLYGFGS